MSLIGFILSLVFVTFALVVTVVVAWMMLAPLLSALRSRKGGSDKPVRKSEPKLKKIDALIEKGQHDDALKLLRKSFILKTPTDAASITKLKELHQNLLSRMLVIAEERGTRTAHIADAEHALMERVELLNLLARADESFHNLRSRREKAGKEFPSWSRSDFESRMKEIRAELESNAVLLNKSLDELVAAIHNRSEVKEPITYH